MKRTFKEHLPLPYVFLSYAPADQKFATRLKDDLEAQGIAVRDRPEIPAGEEWRIAIQNAIRNAQAVVFIASPKARQSIWVEEAEEQLRLAWSLERPVIPLVAAGTMMDALPDSFVNLQYLEAHGKKYQQALSSIVQFIKAMTEESTVKYESILTLHIRISEDPLTAYNLTTIISALTELSTKYWLIAKGRFADLIEYTQTHNGRFAEEANVVVTRITYNSPMNMDWKVDISAPSVAEALVTTIDGITQAPKRLKQKELEIQGKAQEIQHAEQQAVHEQQMATLEQEQRRLEIERQRLETLEKQLEVQKKGIEYALEIAGKVVDLLHPGADPATRAMEIQVLLPNLVQLQNGKGLELALPVSQENKAL